MDACDKIFENLEIKEDTKCVAEDAPVEIIVYCYIAINGDAKILYVDYKKISQLTKCEFEMMALAGSFLQKTKTIIVQNASNHQTWENERYPQLYQSIEKWNQITTNKGTYITIYLHEKPRPRDLWNYLKSITTATQKNGKTINIFIKSCILFSEIYSSFSPHYNPTIRVFWADASDITETSMTFNFKSDEIEAILRQAFGICSMQLSDKSYGFIDVSEEQFDLLVTAYHCIQLIDKKMTFLFTL